MFLFRKLLMIVPLLVLSGCVYRLPTNVLPSTEPFVIRNQNPEEYLVRTEIEGEEANYPVPHDGVVRVGLPTYRPACKVYLFNQIKVSNGDDRLKKWRLIVMRKGTTARTISLRSALQLPTDASGNHILQDAVR